MSDLPELVPATAAAGGDTSSITADEAGLRRRGRTEKREDDAAGDTAGGAPEASLEAMEAEMAKREKKERKQRVRRPRERSKAPSEASDSESEPLDRAKLSPIANRLLEELEADEAAAPSGPARFCRSIVLPIIITLFAFAIISVFKPSYEDWRRVAGAAMMTDEEQIKLQQEAGILPKPAAPAASRAGEAAIKPLRLPQRKGNQPMVIDSKGLTQSQVSLYVFWESLPLGCQTPRVARLIIFRARCAREPETFKVWTR